ncbi:glycosyltransferase family 25 protein [Orbus wheelerorum]|uniref:glycosyltransferase family 25 protein n=1 Tax=Orbus wheelerorum TaxID=3074111 RepID=UPI00370D9C7C
MKTFAINLKREPKKLSNITKECLKNELDVEIIDAVDGKLLSEEYLKEHVYNYPDCKLTRGEIGCSLSHIKIYKRMLADNIPIALILEDDAHFVSLPNSILSKIVGLTPKDSKNVYLLSGCLGSYFPNKKLQFGPYTFYKSYESFLAHGYVITLNAAKNLLKFQEQLKFEADKWYAFELFDCVETYCLIPLLIDTNDKTKEFSTLERDRGINLKNNDRYNQMRKIYNSNLNSFLKRKLLKLNVKLNKIKNRRDGLDI